MATEDPRVLMVGLDAFGPDLLKQWCDDGTLPNLRALREESRFGVVESVANLLPGSVWPTFVTGADPSYHGVAEFMQWDPPSQSFRRPHRSWLDYIPFWQTLGDQGIPGVVMDVPFAQMHQRPGPVIEIQGWGLHDELVPPFTNPPGLFSELNKRHGKSGIHADVLGRRTNQELRRELQVLKKMIRQRTSIVEELSQRYDWRHLFVVYAELHRSGHWHWSERLTGVPLDGVRQVASAFDRELPRLRALLRPQDTLAVFSVHGMGTARDIDRFSDSIWDHFEPQTGTSTGRKLDPVRMANRLLPERIRFKISSAFPTAMRDRLYRHALGAGRDWSETRTILTQPDGRLYLRANLKGRERDGVVEPEEFEAHLDWLIDQVSAIRDDSGAEVFQAIERLAARYNGPRRDWLPDLVANIFDRPLGEVLVMQDGSRIRAPWRGFRDGDHRSSGFFITHGPNSGGGTEGVNIPEEHLARHFLELAGIDYRSAYS